MLKSSSTSKHFCRDSINFPHPPVALIDNAADAVRRQQVDLEFVNVLLDV